MRNAGRIIFAFAAATAATFVSIRLNAFIFQVYGASYASWAHAAAAAAGFVLALAFYGHAREFFAIYGAPSKVNPIIYAVSVAMMYLARNTLVFEAVEGAAVNSPVVVTICVIGGGSLLWCFFSVLLAVLMKFAKGAAARIKRLGRRDAVFLILLFIMLNVIVWLYSHFSQTIYFWDNAGYWRVTHELAATARESIKALFANVYNSVAETDYNYIIAFPGTLLCILFGKSRYVFLAGIVNFYVLPYYTAIYLFIRNKSTRPVLTAVCVYLTFPCFVFFALLGFVDVAGALVCFLAIYLFLRNKKGNFFDCFLAGCLLAAVVLLRRWYAFFALSFAVAAALDALFFKKPRTPKYLLSMLFPFAFIMLFFFQRFVSQRLLGNYSDIYSAYQLGIKTDYFIFVRYYGIIIVLILAVFLAVMFAKEKEERYKAVFLTVIPLLCFALFVSVQTHGQQHLLLYLPAFVYTASLLYCKTMSALRKKSVAVLVCIAALLPAANCFVVREQPSSAAEISSHTLVPNFSFYPQSKAYARDILDLNEYLDELPGADKKVGLLASSFIVNRDILLNAEISLLPFSEEIDRSYLIYLPEVDSRDGLPLAVLECDYIVAVSPLQLHLGEEKQQAIAVPAKSFLEGTDISNAFSLLPRSFKLSGEGVEVFIFEKVREITEDEKAEFISRLEAAFGK